MNIFNPESFEDVSINLEAESTTEEKKGKAKDFFCEHWQSGKVALQLAHDMVKNPIVKLIIRCCIYLGDGIEERICKAE
jgi:hypothetical protein